MLNRLLLLAALSVCLCAPISRAAIIANATGKKVKTGGTAKVVTNTKGQRMIALTIDPGVVTAFELDLLYPNGLVTPAGYDGINSFLTDQAVQFVPPYGGAIGGGASILPQPGQPKTGIINNIQGQYVTLPGQAPTQPTPNRPDGNSDLFTVYFLDNNPTADKVFTVLGISPKGIDPAFASLIRDNYLDVFINDPNDPLNGQTVRYMGEDIEAADIFVPGEPKSVPLPPALFAGLIAGGSVIARAIRSNRRQPA